MASDTRRLSRAGKVEKDAHLVALAERHLERHVLLVAVRYERRSETPPNATAVARTSRTCRTRSPAIARGPRSRPPPARSAADSSSAARSARTCCSQSPACRAPLPPSAGGTTWLSAHPFRLQRHIVVYKRSPFSAALSQCPECRRFAFAARVSGGRASPDVAAGFVQQLLPA